MRAPILLVLLMAPGLAVSCGLQPGDEQTSQAREPEVLSQVTLPGADVLMERGFDHLQGQRVGLLTNRTGRLRDGRRTIDLLWQAQGVKLVRLFSPEHGLRTDLEGRVQDGADGHTNLPVVSLYGQHRRPREEDLEDLDLVIFDLQDVGVRFYTYSTTLFYLLEACSDLKQKHPDSAPGVVILDRPNPLSSYGPRGPLSDPSRRSFICPADMPLMHGLTLGELALWRAAQQGLSVELEVVQLKHWDPASHWSETGLAWIAPSPNLRTPESALLYPMIGMLEASNLSVGRGTDEPFMRLGAAWLDGRALAQRLRARPLPGLLAEALEFSPDSGPFQGELCGGVQFQIVERADLRPVESGLKLVRELIDLGGEEFDWRRVDERLAHASTLEQVRQQSAQDPGLGEVTWSSGLLRWRKGVRPYLLYPRSWD